MSLTIITGPMSSGKTSYLLSEVDKARIASQTAQIYKPLIDKRSSGVSTHSGMTAEAIVLPDTPIYNIFSGIDVIAIEEAQFLSEEWAKVINELSFDVEVICSCLNLDRFGKPFGITPQLLSLADEIISLKAVCIKCKEKDSATRTFGITQSDGQIVVGGLDKYQALCKSCWRTSIGDGWR